MSSLGGPRWVVALGGNHMTIAILATVLRAIWLIGELTHASYHKVAPAKDWDRSSLKILKLATLTVPVGVIIGFTDVGHIHTQGNFLGAIGFALMLAGISIRWLAIHNLGRYFTRTVTIMDDHRIIRTGLYRYLRHPSYAGYLLGNLGLGMAYSNWLSIVIIFVPDLAASLYRISIEEDALFENFGDEYFEYARSTKRLIPKLY
jgi:protein-S-isoprenylcysteine O-methyltransferase Ste14